METKALAAEHKLVRWGGVAANPGRFARITVFLLEAGIPDPTDVLFLFIDFFGSLAEARAKLRQDWYAIGFAQGMSARLLGFRAAEAIKMLRWSKRVAAHGSVGEEVAGYTGIRQRATIEGGVAGYSFANGLTDSERTAFFHQAGSGLRAEKKTIGREKPSQQAVRRTHLGNVIVEEELDPSESAPESELYEFDLDDVLAFALAVRPAVLELFEAAAEAAAEERARQELEERSETAFPQAF